MGYKNKKTDFRLFLGMIAFCLCMGAAVLGTGVKAEAKRLLAKPKGLQEKKVYSYDIDGDKKKEKIRYTYSVNDSYKTKIKITVNGKKYYQATFNNSFNIDVFLFDLYEKDNRMNLFIYGTADSDCLGDIKVLKCRGRSAKVIAKGKGLKGESLNAFRMLGKLTQAKKDGKFYLYLDTPRDLSDFGCYFAKVAFQIKNRKIVIVPQIQYRNAYKFTYTVARSFQMYQKPSLSSRTSTVKKGTKLKILAVRPISGNGDSENAVTFVKVKLASGKVGWVYQTISYKEKTYFAERPTWG